MAKAKTIKNTPTLQAQAETDFTFNNPSRAVIRFNASKVIELNVDLQQLSVSGVLYDEVNKKEYSLVGELTEKE